MYDGISKKCILICAGELNTAGLKHIPITNELVIAVDGGLGYCRTLDIEPDIILGDFDSAEEEDFSIIRGWSEDKPDSVITLPCEKDDTDTIAAVKLGFEKGCTEFELYGAMGGRMDHYVANLQTLFYIKHHGGNAKMIDGSGETFIIENETVNFDELETGTISLFAFGGKAEGVSIRGLYYEADDISLTVDFPLGVSNKFIGEDAFVTVSDGSLLCIKSNETY